MTLAGVIALIALAVTLSSLVYLHLVATGLSPIRNAVSQYGISAHRGGYRVATLAFGAAGLALAIGIAGATSGAGRSTVVALLVVFALARWAISWYPMDVPGAERTPNGRTHGMLAIAAFAAAIAAALRLGTLLAHEARWHGLAPVSTGLGWAMLACIVAMLLGRSSAAWRAYFGLIERGFYLAAICWFALFSLACALAIR